MTRIGIAVCWACMLLALFCRVVACQGMDPTPLPAATSTPTKPLPPSPTSTSTPQPTPTHTATPTPEPTATPKGHLEVAVILHGPSRFLQVEHMLSQNDVTSVPVQAHAGEPIPDLLGYDAVILSGGEYAPSQFDTVSFLQAERERVLEAIDDEVPVLGICLGHQLLAQWLGGRVERSAQFEVGWLEVTVNPDGLRDPLLDGIGERYYAFLWHGDEVTELPPGALSLASSDLCPIQVFRYRDLPVWGVQSNPQYDARLAERVLLGAPWLANLGIDAEAMAARGYEVDDGSQGRIFSNFFTFVRQW